MFVCLFELCKFLPQNKFSAPASVQLSPRRSLVTPEAPLRPLLDSGEEAPCDGATNVSINNSIRADGEIKKLKEQLPPQHPVRNLSISAADIRKKLSSAQLDDLLVMIGAEDYIKLVFADNFVCFIFVCMFVLMVMTLLKVQPDRIF